MRLPKAIQHLLAALTFTLLPIATHAQGQFHSLVFTELSDKVLTATLDGEPNGDVQFLGLDHWEWNSGIYGDRLAWYGGTTYYERPAGAAGVNRLTIGLIDGNVRFLIDSGVLGLDSEVKSANGGPGSSFAVFNNSATVLGPTTIYFLEVPEPGTLAQIGLGAVMLLLFRMGPKARNESRDTNRRYPSQVHRLRATCSPKCLPGFGSSGGRSFQR